METAYAPSEVFSYRHAEKKPRGASFLHACAVQGGAVRYDASPARRSRDEAVHPALPRPDSRAVFVMYTLHNESNFYQEVGQA